MKKFFYRVNKGETVLSVSEKFGIPPTVIIGVNALNKEIEEGDVLFIEETGGRTYDVQPFDTLNGVAEKFGVLPEALKTLNGVDYVFYGLDLIIPD